MGGFRESIEARPWPERDGALKWNSQGEFNERAIVGGLGVGKVKENKLGKVQYQSPAVEGAVTTSPT